MDKYPILIAHPNKAFDAERLKGDAIVFVDFYSENSDDYYFISCDSEENQQKVLKILNNETEKQIQYALGFSHGRKSFEFEITKKDLSEA